MNYGTNVEHEDDMANLEQWLPRHDFALAGAATLTGAAVGVVVGIIGGPGGMIAGGAIGTTVGAIIAKGLARDEVYRDVRDRELDETIGVTDGSMGTAVETKNLELAQETLPVPETGPKTEAEAEEQLWHGER